MLEPQRSASELLAIADKLLNVARDMLLSDMSPDDVAIEASAAASLLTEIAERLRD